MGRLDLGIFHGWLLGRRLGLPRVGKRALGCLVAASARRESDAFLANECAMRRACTSDVSAVSADSAVVRREFAGRIVRGVPTPSRPVGARRFLMRHGEDVVNRCYLIINLDFIFRRLVGARVVAGRIRRPPLLPSDISRLPPHAQPRARDTANDVPPKSAPEVDVEEAGEPLVETQPY